MEGRRGGGGGGGGPLEHRKFSALEALYKRTWREELSHRTPFGGHRAHESSRARYVPLEHCKQIPRALSGKLPKILHIAHSDEPMGAYLDGGHFAQTFEVEFAWRYRPTLQVKQLPCNASTWVPPSQVEQFAEPATAYVALGQSSHTCDTLPPAILRTLCFPTPQFVQ